MNEASPTLENPLKPHVRDDIPARFNEITMLDKQWARVLSALEGHILPPYEVLIHPSSACNLRCVWCIGDHVPIQQVNDQGVTVFLDAAKTNTLRLPDNMAEPEAMRKLIQGIIDYKKVGSYQKDGLTHTEEFKVEAVSFSGLIGEPLVCKKALMPAMRLLVENGLRTGIFTNGVLMDETTWDTLVHVGYVHLSLDASRGETYRALKFGDLNHGEERFRQALANLAGLVKKKAQTPGATVDINASFILYPENYGEVYEAARLLKDIGVEHFRVKQDISTKRLLNQEQRKHAIALLDQIEAELVDENFKLVRIHRLSNPAESQRTFSHCYVTELMAAIGSDGHLYPCNYHPRPDGASYGSAIDRPFAEVWEGAARARIKQGLPKICPSVCDPFKNRANRLLNTAAAVHANEGAAQLAAYKDELFALA